MSRTGNYIEDKVEEFRIAGGKPLWIGLTLEVLTKLSDEYRAKTRQGDVHPHAKITKFIGLDVVVIDNDMAPKDGVYIHEVKL